MIEIYTTATFDELFLRLPKKIQIKAVKKKIFAIAAKEDLKIGPLEGTPPKFIHSNTVNVRRIR